MIDLKKYLRGEKGFTLVEMMVVLIIIGVLIAGGIRFYSGYIGGSRVTKAKGDISTLSAALDAYYAANNTYPKDVTNLNNAGISTAMCTLDPGVAGVPYIYKVKNDPPTEYAINTYAKVDGTNYVVASGGVTAAGQSDSAYTTSASLILP